MPTGLRRDWREGGKRVIELSTETAQPAHEAAFGTPAGELVWYAKFRGWGESLVGAGASREQALSDLSDASRIPAPGCLIREP